MPLLTEDEAYLRDRGIEYRIEVEGGVEHVIFNQSLSDRYDQPQAEIALKIPTGYRMTPWDMFWVSPAIRLRTGAYPPASETFETFLGRSWQRFSRHLPSWRPGVDSLRSFLPLVLSELTQ